MIVRDLLLYAYFRWFGRVRMYKALVSNTYCFWYCPNKFKSSLAFYRTHGVNRQFRLDDQFVRRKIQTSGASGLLAEIKTCLEFDAGTEEIDYYELFLVYSNAGITGYLDYDKVWFAIFNLTMVSLNSWNLIHAKYLALACVFALAMLLHTANAFYVVKTIIKQVR